MPKLECALAEANLKVVADDLLLSVVILSYRRIGELKFAVESIASQITEGLCSKVEIIISDNGSGGETLELIRALAEQHPSVSYLVHSRNEGGFFNMFAAPWRARGRYYWIFGSDDVLLDGGVASVVQTLEAQGPSFLTLNKRAATSDLSALIWERANSVPDATFSGFADLFCAMGVNQLAFISCQIEATDRARQFDVELYLQTDTRHPHVAAFLEKHYDRTCIYSADNHVVHRLENSPLADYHSGNFFDYAATFPSLLWRVIEKTGTAKDLFERATGSKRIDSYDEPKVKLIDSIFENILRASRYDMFLSPAHKRTVEQIILHCRPDRREQFEQICDFTEHLAELKRRHKMAGDELEKFREKAMQASALFSRPSP